MSAKQALRRPELDIGILPTEIINEVLRHATWVPYEIAPSDLVLKRMQSSEAKKFMRDYKQSLVTKRYLVRVCKKWQQLAYLFLYEWILVTRTKHLQQLAVVIEKRNHDHTQIGWCTKRLDINFRWAGDEDFSDEARNAGPLLLRLLRGAINLEVLVVGHSLDYSWMHPSVSPSWCPELKFLNWAYSTNKDPLDEEVWIQFLGSHTNLIGINCSLTKKTSHPTPPFTHSLLTWNASYSSLIPIAQTFVSLQRLSLTLDWRAIDKIDWDLGYFITSPIPSLTDLQLNFSYPYAEAEYAKSNVPMVDISSPWRCMPRLRRLDLIFPVWPTGWNARYVLPHTVSELGIRVCSAKPRRQLVREVLQILKRLVQQALGRVTIQFLDERNTRSILLHEDYLVRHTNDILEHWVDHEGREHNLSWSPVPVE